VKARPPRPAPTLIDFMSDKAMLGPYFAGPSWDVWKAIVKAAKALPMSERDKVLFARVSGGRAPPSTPVRELVVAAGRGAGKDSIATAAATYTAATGDFSRLRPGEKACVLLLACDRDQAAIARDYIGGYFRDVPMLTPLIERETSDTIELTNGAQIIIGTNNTRAPRGRTSAAPSTMRWVTGTIRTTPIPMLKSTPRSALVLCAFRARLRFSSHRSTGGVVCSMKSSRSFTARTIRTRSL